MFLAVFHISQLERLAVEKTFNLCPLRKGEHGALNGAIVNDTPFLDFGPGTIRITQIAMYDLVPGSAILAMTFSVDVSGLGDSVVMTQVTLDREGIERYKRNWIKVGHRFDFSWLPEPSDVWFAPDELTWDEIFAEM